LRPILDSAQLKSVIPFSTPIQIRFSDIDGYLHVNNGIYFNYFEHARAVFLYETCDWDVMNIGTVVGRIEIDYLRPIHLHDQVEALVRCTRVGNSSFDLEQFLVGTDSKGAAQVYSRSKCTMVAVDMHSMRPVAVPGEYRLKLAAV